MAGCSGMSAGLGSYRKQILAVCNWMVIS
jgi:hypothetical protein